MEHSKIRKHIEWDWRSYFTHTVLKQAEQDEKYGKMVIFTSDPGGRWAYGTTSNGFRVRASKLPASYTECVEFNEWNRMQEYYFSARQRKKNDRFSCNCSMGMNGVRCRHLASLLLRMEKEHGMFSFDETEEERDFRIKREEEERRRILREKEREKKQKRVFGVLDYLKDRVPAVSADRFFRPDLIVRDILTNQYETDQTEEFRNDGKTISCEYRISYNQEGEQELEAKGKADDQTVTLRIGRMQSRLVSCTCGRCKNKQEHYYWSREPEEAKFCCHAVAVYEQLWKRLILENPGDATDQKADQLLALLADHKVVEEQIEEKKNEKTPILVLIPRIVAIENSEKLELAFQLGRAGEKAIMLRSLEKLVADVEHENIFALSKKVILDFSEVTFTEESLPWYSFIASRVRNVHAINQKLNSGFYYTRQLSVGGSVPLEGSDLDVVFDLTEEKEILYQYGKRGSEVLVKAGSGKVKAEITLAPVKAEDGSLTGIRLSGSMPRLLKGNQYQYVLDTTQFGRVSGQELSVLSPYRAIASPNGDFSCVVGKKKFPEFYYRILPELRSSRFLLLHDQISDLDTDFLPPEPEFCFYIDLTAETITCRPEVRYGENSLTADGIIHADMEFQRDLDQEKRVLKTVGMFFPGKEGEVYTAPSAEENLIRILSEGVAVLSRFGEVKGSQAFQSVHVYPAPSPKVSIRVDGGLLDLSIQTKDLSEEDLLELLSSYRLKKKWHRMRSGDFVDLRHADELKELDELAAELDLNLEELVHKDVRIPKYRSLYVDKLLESHDEIAASRDRNFKALVRSFRTINDSDFEVSEPLAEVMRPYQTYGFRWLSTLSQSGFGGILADEMGLGKTLQMLAFIEAQRRAGEKKPALVVCPASLVYNWKEECNRFTPELPVELLAGTLPQRKALYKKMETDDKGTLYVISYDLLKRDITFYESVLFFAVILDEAQYIKNQKAAVTKAVKVLHADHRFALTGTPIENRLSELWSIFDFLMPGFLYTSAEFGNRFENPIMKRKDERATRQLSRMTEPFVLRRKKEDVLKDLPEKLEEVQSSAMEADQRRLYDAQVVHMKEMLGNYGETGEDKLRILAEITRLRQICCDPGLLFDDYHGSSAKREACLELIQRAIDGGHRMLVFSQFTSMLALLSEDLKKEKIPFYTITGSTPKQERIRLVNAFNEGDTPVFLISLKAGGTGLNLTGADVVIHYDPWWNLAVQNQATDRAHRIGQTKQVTVIKLIAAESIEEKIIDLQEAKRDLADAIIGGQSGSLMNLSREELLELLS